MPATLKITLTEESLAEGTPEEQATFGTFAIRSTHGAAEAVLTEGFDSHSDKHRVGPLVSGHYAADWLLWNWWRLRWEPPSNTLEWALAHRMPSIDEGYVWPNIAISSDGVRTILVSRPSARSDAKPFRYAGSPLVAVLATLWENAVDGYVNEIVDRLGASGIRDANVGRLKEDIEEERADQAVSNYRRLEAMLGREPDSGEDDTVDGLVADGGRLGLAALGEVAANFARASAKDKVPITAREFAELAQDKGYRASPCDAAELASTTDLPRPSDVPAWRLGVATAQALRKQERLGDSRIDNPRLAQLAGVQPKALTGDFVGGAGLSFMLDEGEGPDSSRLVMRSKRETGRRFELARLIGDRLLENGDALRPATRTYTYRQKAQRAFAAEFLSPFRLVEDMLGDDYDDDELWNEVAGHFVVSPKVVETQLRTHDKLDRHFEGIVPEGAV